MRKEKGKVIIVVSIILLDQLSKVLVEKFGLGIMNKGMVFGLLSCYFAILLIFLGILAILGKKHNFPRGLIFIMAGGVSNLTDRVFRGGVVDFIDIKIIPVFNFADIAICVGVSLFLIDFIFKRRV